LAKSPAHLARFSAPASGLNPINTPHSHHSSCIDHNFSLELGKLISYYQASNEVGVGSSGARHGGGGRLRRRGAELAAGLREPAQRGARGRGRRPGVVGQQRGRVRAELRRPAPRRLRAQALRLRRALRREHLLGFRRQGLVGGGRRGVLGGGEAVLPPRHQLVLGAGGAVVRALHAGGVAQQQGHRMRSRRLRQQPRRLHHLQLQAARQLGQSMALLDQRYIQHAGARTMHATPWLHE
jgi:hypothetical protein